MRIKKADLPDGTPLESAYRADAQRAPAGSPLDPRRGRQDARRSSAPRPTPRPRKIYAASFGKDPDFYDFYRAMQSYQRTFIGDGANKSSPTNIIMSPNNEYLKEFAGR